MSGWVKLSRKILDWEWKDDTPTFLLFIELLLRANYKDNKYRGHKIPCGSVVYGHEAFAKYANISVQHAQRLLPKPRRVLG